VPLLFLLACAGIFALTYQLLIQKSPAAKPGTSPPESGLSSSSGLLPVSPSSYPLPGHSASTREQDPFAPSAPDQAPAEPDANPQLAATTVPAPPVGPPPDYGGPPPGSAATAALERFLAAPDLNGRVADLLSEHSIEQLAATCLAGKLPAPAIPSIDQQLSFQNERLTEYHFTVSFPEAKPPRPRQVKVIVHQRGNDARPLVLADAFVDLFDGKLLEFGKAPVAGMKTFHAVVEAVRRCDDPRVPAAEKKFALRLLANDVARDGPNRSDPGRDLGVAYAGRLSPLGEMLDRGSSGLNWGRPQSCRVTLQWNQVDDPRRPYLEVVRLDSLSWGH
jgi:hypothetical protein